MPHKLSAGILLYRMRNGGVLEVLIAHMGGPFWKNRDDGGWSIPKGEYMASDDPFEVACREFQEELGSPVPAKAFLDLGSVKQPSGKVLSVWAAKGAFDVSKAVSNTFEMEWPKGSGSVQQFPEVDRVAWFDIPQARRKLLPGHLPFLDRLAEAISHQERSQEAATVQVPLPFA
jgi:predicted NUDIX family NTP pyrophosphohydrolase